MKNLISAALALAAILTIEATPWGFALLGAALLIQGGRA